MEDKRFANVVKNPKFQHIPNNEKKVKIDKRFQCMLTDEDFNVKYTVDNRGRPVNKTSTKDLQRYYNLSSEESSSEKEEQEENDVEVGKYGKFSEESDEESTSEIKDLTITKSDVKISDDIKRKLKDLTVDYARGEGNLFSDSSSDDESEEEGNLETDEIEHKWGELDADAERTDEITHRLAVCNMDWDKIRAVDLMVLFNSFVPQGGVIRSVTIFPSEFGRERMKEEEAKGPIELVERKHNLNKEDEKKEGSKYHMEKFRQYQLNRLKYYFAVIICDNPNTADKIYNECDGMEYESSATKIDLRFIPNDITFDEDPKETCDKMPDATKYQPRFFTTTALQQAKVDLTWDETNPERIEIFKKIQSSKMDNIDENDLERLQPYLASSSDSSDEEDEVDEKSDSKNEKENSIAKYRALLEEIEMNEKKEQERKDNIHMELIWGIDLEEKTNKLKKEKEKEDKTPFEQYLDKRKEKRKEKREERKKKNENNEEDIDEAKDSDVPSDVDMNDPYFAEEFNKEEFKKKKKKNVANNEDIDKEKEAELQLLVMSNDNKDFSSQEIQDQKNDTKSKKKRKKKQKQAEKDDDYDFVNVHDPRFSALYTNHQFNIDPADPHFKPTKGMEKFIQEKLRRNEEVSKRPKLQNTSMNNPELNALVKSVKRKAQAFINKKS